MAGFGKVGREVTGSYNDTEFFRKLKGISTSFSHPLLLATAKVVIFGHVT